MVPTNVDFSGEDVGQSTTYTEKKRQESMSNVASLLSKATSELGSLTYVQNVDYLRYWFSVESVQGASVMFCIYAKSLEAFQ